MSEKTPAPRPAPAAAPPPPKRSPHWLRQSLREIVIIVIGILLSLWISDLVQSAKEQERATVYLNRLHRDLAEDLSQLETDLNQRTGQLESAQKILSALNGPDPQKSSAVLVSGFQQLLWTARFSPKDATFRSLESTGDLRLIENDSIVNALMNLYRGSYKGLEDNNNDITKFRDNFLLPYIMENVNFRQVFTPRITAAPPEVRNSDELYNQLIYEQISMSSTVQSHQRNIKSVRALRAMIERELAR